MTRPRKYDHDAILGDWQAGMTTQAIVRRYAMASERALWSILRRRRVAGDPRAVYRIEAPAIDADRRCIAVSVSAADFDELSAAAKARGQTVTGLCRKIVSTIASERMVDAVLDDRS